MSISDNNAKAKLEELQSANLSGIVAPEKNSYFSNAKCTSQGSKTTSESVFWSRRNGLGANVSPTSVNSKQPALRYSESDGLLIDFGLSEEQELIRFQKVSGKKDFRLMERSNGKMINVLQGLELHTGVFNSEEQRKIVNCVLNLQQKGQNGELRGMITPYIANLLRFM